jgi:hypothetical protein
MGYAGYGNNSDQKPGDTSSTGKPGGAGERQDRAVKTDASVPPSAGPHESPELVNPDATPGTGALPTPGAQDGTESTSS